MKEFSDELSIFRECRAFKNQVTSELCSTLDSCYWRELYFFILLIQDGRIEQIIHEEVPK